MKIKIKLYFKKLILVILYFVFIIINFSCHEKIYVTLTSWKGRINFIHKNFECILNNTIKPNKIILNLAIEEFPKKYFEFPKGLVFLLKKNKNLKIFWVKKIILFLRN